MSDAIPALPELDNERMGALRTLQEVVDYLAEAAGASDEPDPDGPGNGGGDFSGLFGSKPARTRGELEGALFDAVAEKTGYPREMLEAAMDLESDLGVDSIKRVEILGAVSEAIPDLPELDNEALGRLRTLGDVIDHLASVGAGLGFAHLGSHKAPADPSSMLVMPPAAPEIPKPDAGLPPIRAAAEYAAEAREPIALRRRVVRFTEAPAGRPVPLEGPVLLTDDLHGRAAALGALLEARGLTVHRIDPDWTDAAAVSDAVPVGVRSVVHLAAAGAPADQLDARVRGAFLVARATGPVVLFATVSALGGHFGHDALAGHWLEGALAGLTKTLALEWTDTRALALDLAADVSAEALADALSVDRGVVEVGLSPAPVALRTVNQPLPARDGALPLEAGDLVVVSGGARGVTAAVVVALAERVPAHFLLLGRSALTDEPGWAAGTDDDGLQAAWLADCKARGAKPHPKEMQADLDRVARGREVRATLAAIEAAGAGVTYATADVRDADGVSAAIADQVAAHGPVRGVIHGAGVLADKLVVDKPVDAFDKVFSVKVDGWRALLGAVDRDALKLAVAFTSVAGRFGNLGQCDYAMANEALAHGCMALAADGVRAVAADWGPWDGGMVTAALKKNFARQGLTAIPPDLGAAALCDELARGSEVEVVLEGPRPNAGSLVRHFDVATDPWLADHRIGERPVVPVAVVLEWFAQLAHEVYPCLQVVAVRDLAVLKGVVLDGPTDLTLTWQPAAPRDGGLALAFELVGGPGPLGAPTVHYRAVVDLAEQRLQPERFPGSNGLGANPYTHPTGEAYEAFLFHGPSFRGIDEIVGISDHGMVGRLRAGGEGALGLGGDWQTDPVAIDSALQLMLLWVRDQTGLGALPNAVKEYRQFRDFPERVACHLEVDKLSERRGRFTATLVDDEDNVVAVLGGGEYTADPALNEAFRNGRS